jgi:hypothetical protein
VEVDFAAGCARAGCTVPEPVPADKLAVGLTGPCPPVGTPGG